MERKRITCPITAHLEEIDFERTPLGIVIDQCSRFVPRCAIECECECARRMDRRDMQFVDDRDERVLLLVAARDDEAGAIADVVAQILAVDRFVVERATPDLRTAPPPPDYDAVIIGSSVRRDRLYASVLAYVTAYRDELAGMPTFLFFVGDPPAPTSIPWSPTGTATFVHHGLEESARIQAFAEMIADKVPAIGAAEESNFAKVSRAVEP